MRPPISNATGSSILNRALFSGYRGYPTVPPLGIIICIHVLLGGCSVCVHLCMSRPLCIGVRIYTIYIISIYNVERPTALDVLENA